jgi:hypothetical protein
MTFWANVFSSFFMQKYLKLARHSGQRLLISSGNPQFLGERPDCNVSGVFKIPADEGLISTLGGI